MNAVSDATGLPLATVVDMDRRLVMGGLRTRGGRGLHAAQMTPLDAARLLTAVLASPQANASVDAVERYAQTRIDKARSSDDLFNSVHLNDLSVLPVRHGFVDALAALIASASNGSLSRLVLQSDDGSMPRIEIFAFTRATRGRIRISGLPDGLTASIEYAPAPTVRRSSRTKGTQSTIANESNGDLEQSRRVTERTVLSIAETLGTGGPHAGV